MKAAVIRSFGEPDVFEIADVPTPEIDEEEILIEVVSGSLNPIDWKQRRGNHKFIMGSPFPIVLGYDVAGVVVKTGGKVTAYKPGDRVCGVLRNKYGGGLGQFAKGKEESFTLVPDSVNLEESAALPLAGLTALQALCDKGQISSGSKILVIGAAGGVGHYAIQLAAIFGAEIHAVSSEKHFAFLNSLANCILIDYKKTDVFSLTDQYDLIFDTIGYYPFPKCRKLLKPGGIHVNTLPRPKILYYKFLSLFTKGKKARTLLMKNNKTQLAQLMDYISAGKLKIRIDKSFKLENIAQAHAYMEEGHTQGKILIRYR